MSEKFADERTQWRGAQLSYEDHITEPNDARENLYCLTAPQAKAIIAISELWRYGTRWYTDSALDAGAISQFINDMQRRLMMPCGESSVTLFIWSDDGVLQESTDGGATYHPAPQFDPRNSSPLFPPAEGSDGDDKRCKAADGMVTLIKEQIGDNLTDDMIRYDLQELLTDFVSTMLSSGGNVFTTLVTIATNRIFALVILTVRLALTSDFYDLLRCALYNNMADDASFDASQAEAARVEVAALTSTAGGLFMQHLLWLLGSAGMTNLARAGAGADDADCDCGDGCQSDNWKIYEDEHPYTWGTFNNSTSDSITVDAIIVPSVGGYGAGVVRKSLGLLCHVTTSFPSGGATAWGGNTDLTHIVLDGSGNPITIGNPPVDCNLLCAISTSPFTITFTFSPDES